MIIADYDLAQSDAMRRVGAKKSPAGNPAGLNEKESGSARLLPPSAEGEAHQAESAQNERRWLGDGLSGHGDEA